MVQCADDMSSLISHLASNNAMSDYIHHCLRHSLIPQWRDHISANSFHISKQITESHHAPSKFTTFEVVVNILPMFSNGEKTLSMPNMHAIKYDRSEMQAITQQD